MGDRLADVADYLACLITLVGTAGKALSDRGRRSDPALRYVYACGLCLGLGLATTPPATFTAASGLGSWAWSWFGFGCLRLVSDELELLAVGFLAMLAYSIQPPDGVRGGVRGGLRRQAAITAGAFLPGLTVSACRCRAGPRTAPRTLRRRPPGENLRRRRRGVGVGQPEHPGTGVGLPAQLVGWLSATAVAMSPTVPALL